MIKDDFKKAEEQGEAAAAADPWRLSYHLMPPAGWLNDPNGLSQYKGTHHIFYQYDPQDVNGRKGKGWGHYTTKDFVHYKQLPTALYPDSWMDKDGAYSGSALVEPEEIRFYYTGNIKFPVEHDYIHSGRGHYVNTFSTPDGFTFTEKENLLKNEDYPADMTNHVRDPKVWKEGERYYMVLGARDNNDHGLALRYVSDNGRDWKYDGRIETEEPFGYMWECPDLIEADGQELLICCPQGIDRQGYDYENVYQNGYFRLEGDKAKEFTELDHGFDFYAPQSYVDEAGRRILIGWMGIPDADYTNPTTERGWQHALTIPRVLEVVDAHIYQRPLPELMELREEAQTIELEPDKKLEIDTNVFELELNVAGDFRLQLRQDCELSYHGGLFTLKLGASGYGRDERHVKIADLKQLRIFSDTSSLEIFLNEGQEVLSTRLYEEGDTCSLISDTAMSGTLWKLKSFIIEKAEH